MNIPEVLIQICRDTDTISLFVLMLILLYAAPLPFAMIARISSIAREMIIERRAIRSYAESHRISRSSVGIGRMMTLGGHASFEVFDKANYWGSRKVEFYGKKAGDV